MINGFFDRIVYINSKANKIELRRRVQMCARNGVSITKYEYLSDDVRVPDSSFLTKDELAILTSFFCAVNQARTDNVSKLLVLQGNFHFVRDFRDKFEEAVYCLPSEWDLFYLGPKIASLKEKPNDKNPKLVYPAFYAEGEQAIAINSSIYVDVLENIRVPLYSLHEHIKTIASRINIFVAKPALIIEKAI